MQTPSITKAQAKTLAVRYSAFNAARERGDDNGVCVWGDLLLEIVEETGVDLIDPSNVQSLVRVTRRIIAHHEDAEREAA